MVHYSTICHSLYLYGILSILTLNMLKFSSDDQSYFGVIRCNYLQPNWEDNGIHNSFYSARFTAAWLTMMPVDISGVIHVFGSLPNLFLNKILSKFRSCLHNVWHLEDVLFVNCCHRDSFLTFKLMSLWNRSVWNNCVL